VANTTNTGVTWSVQEGAAAGTLTASGVFTPAKAGTFHIIATSQTDASKTATATVTVTAPAPSFASQPSTVAAEGQAYTYAPHATDPANSAISFALTDAPAGATMSAGTLTWTPTHAQARTPAKFTLTVTTAAGGSAAQTWTVTPTGIINGLAVVTYVTESGDVDQPSDATNATVNAYIPGAAGFVTIAGSGDANGRYRVAGVPSGGYWLQVNHDYVWTDRNDLDLGTVSAGRPGLETASSGTAISLTASNASPLNAFDHFQVVVPNAGVVRDQAVAAFTSGDTTASLNVGWLNTSLVDAAAGDYTYVTQLDSPELVYGRHIYFLSKAASGIALTTADAVTTPLSTLLDFPSRGASFEAKLNGSEFVALSSAVNPNATVRGTNVSLGVQALGNSHGSLQWPNPKVVAYYGEDGAISSDVDFFTLVANNPFPSQWPLIVEYDQPFGVQYTVPGTSLKLTLISHVRTAAVPNGDTVRPFVAPVASPSINGASFFLDQSNVGLSPSLSWTVPSGATGYRISVMRLYDGGGFAAAEEVAVLHTTSATITLPPGVMSVGNAYFIIIQAHAEPGVDYSYSPFRHALPHGLAAASSGVITP
jgi:hypothetical protein